MQCRCFPSNFSHQLEDLRSLKARYFPPKNYSVYQFLTHTLHVSHVGTANRVESGQMALLQSCFSLLQPIVSLCEA